MMFDNVDVTNVYQTHNTGMNYLQDTYISSVHSKLNNMESRTQQAENALPKLGYTHIEETEAIYQTRYYF